METDEQFVAAVRRNVSEEGQYHELTLKPEAMARLLSLALRGAKVQWRPPLTAPTDGSEFQGFVKYHSMTIWEPRCRLHPENGALQVWDRVYYDEHGWDYNGQLIGWLPQPSLPALGEPENTNDRT